MLFFFLLLYSALIYFPLQKQKEAFQCFKIKRKLWNTVWQALVEVGRGANRSDEASVVGLDSFGRMYYPVLVWRYL